MNIQGLISDPQLTASLRTLRQRLQQPEHRISDIQDAAGNQYVDIVMEGGGMLGIALVGYSWALEQMGIRFLGIGGTSAGSINALLLAAMDDPSEAKSPRLLEELGRKDFYDFVDGGQSVRNLIERALDGKPTGFFKGLSLGWKTFVVRDRLLQRFGLNPGDRFTWWLQQLLASAGIETLADLEARLAVTPDGLHHRQPDGTTTTENLPGGRLVIVSADISTETRVEFPRMAGLYWSQLAQVSPARFARASMSIPFFFEPMKVADVPQGPEAEQRWRELAGYEIGKSGARLPETAIFVDGGVMSNFPIDAFHQVARVPRMPTFGVKLEYDARYSDRLKAVSHAGSFRDLMTLAGKIFNSARHTLDYEFIKRNPDYRHLVSFIPCTGINWLDFNMPAAHKEALFREGAKQAIAFVETFSGPVDASGRPATAEAAAFTSKWAWYQQLRGRLSRAHAD